MDPSTDHGATRSGTPFFDLHIKGTGYLNRFRTVPVPKGAAYYRVDINALEGAQDDVSYTLFDARVRPDALIALLKRFETEILDADTKVYVQFRLGGARPEAFTYQKGPRVGEQRFVIKTTLLRIDWVKIKRPGGASYEDVYRYPGPTERNDSENTPAASLRGVA